MRNLITVILLVLSVSTVNAQLPKGLEGYKQDMDPMNEDLIMDEPTYWVDAYNDTTYAYIGYNDYYGIGDVLTEAQRVLNENGVALGINIEDVLRDMEYGVDVKIEKEYHLDGGFYAAIHAPGDEAEFWFVLYYRGY